jgi:hypothetical protein
MPLFEWDERKRAVNLAKHGVDFELAKLIFNGPTLEGPDNRGTYGERRVAAYGEANGLVPFVIYTWRGPCRRLISARKAGTHEQEIYRAHIAAAHGSQDEG